MKRFLYLIIAFVAFTTVHAQTLSLTDITSGKFSPAGTNYMVSSVDGESYYQANREYTMIIRYSYKTGQPIDTIFNVKKARECKIESFQGFIISPDEKKLLVYTDYESIYRRSFKATYYYYDIRRNLIRNLTENTSKQSVPTFSRDGRMLAYVMDNNIWLAKFDYDTESQVTKDGEAGKIINGATDWVYEEEFGITSLMDFSADGKLLAFVKFDESAVKEYSMQLYKGQLYPSLVSFKYPKAGERNSTVSCNVFDIDAKTIRQMNLPDNSTEYIPRIEFLPSGDELAVMTLNRDQNQFNMYYANARSTVSRLILQEKNDRYIDSELIKTIRFFDNQFVYVSEKSGYRHIYLYDNTGVEQKALTSGNYDVTDLLEVDPASKTVFFESAEDSPLQRAVYKLDMAKGTKTKLSAKEGYNSAEFSKNGKYFVNTFTNVSTPPLISLHDASGKELRVLEDNARLKQLISNSTLPAKEFTTVRGQDGTELNAYILKPANFNPSQKYPLLMVQYSGPDSQQVLDHYQVDWTSYLVSQGYIVACVDGRGTGARGQEFRKCTYLNLGIKESDDQIAAARHFASLPYIDSNRIAIWGWSYGGYNVLMSMSRGNGIFAAGIAIAPVTDWKFYDTVYTERFMKTPQQNATGYAAGSLVMLAGQLTGNLFLVHGSADDNVHFQNTMEYADALVKANKQFDMFVFTDKNHSIGGAANRTYLYEKIIRFLNTNM